MRLRLLFTLILIGAGAVSTAPAAPSISNETVWNDRGIGHFRSGDYRDAITCFGVAYRLRPEEETIRFNLASAHSRLAIRIAESTMTDAVYAEAVGEAESAITLEPEHPYFYSVLGYVHQEMRRFEEAYRAFSRAAELDPGDGGTRALLGNAAYELDNLDDAIAHWRNALDLDPDLDQINERVSKADKERGFEVNFRTEENEHFRIRYDPDIPGGTRFARRMLGILDDARRTVNDILPLRTAAPVSVVVYNRGEFRRMMGGHGWTGGLYDGKIRVPFPRSGEPDETFRTLATHEYVHAVIYEWTGDRCPAWLNEGLAQSIAGEWDDARESEAKRMARESLYIPLAELERSFLEIPEQRIDAAYIESYLVANHIRKTWTVGHLHRLLEQIAAGTPTGDALREIFHLTRRELLEESIAPYTRGLASR